VIGKDGLEKYAWVLYVWASRRTHGCRGRTCERRGGREDTHVGVEFRDCQQR
jgi:hypothetical protein